MWRGRIWPGDDDGRKGFTLSAFSQHRDPELCCYLQFGATESDGTGVQERAHSAFSDLDSPAHVRNLCSILPHAELWEPGFCGQQATSRCSLLNAPHLQHTHSQVLDANWLAGEAQFPRYRVKGIIMPFLISIGEQPGICRQLSFGCR